MAVALALFGLLVGSVQIRSTTACPSGEAVALELQALIGTVTLDKTPLSADLTEDDEGLVLTLHDREGALLATHHFGGVASCEVRALTAAAVIAAWTGTLTNGSVPTPQIFVPPPVMELGTGRAAERPRKLAFEVGAAFLGAVAGISFAPGALVHADFARPRSRWAGRVAAFGTGNRNEPLGAGTIAWTRIGISAGPLVRFSPSRFTIDLHAEGIAALVRIEGTDFRSDQVSYGFDPGLGGGVQFGVRIGNSMPVIGLMVAGWPRSQIARVSGLPAQAELPRVEALFSAGVAFGLF